MFSDVFINKIKWRQTGFVAPPQCMPEKYKNANTVRAYRDYYKGEKARFAKWNYTEKPKWW